MMAYLTRNFVTQITASHDGGACSVLLRALGMARMSMQRRSLSTAANDGFGLDFSDQIISSVNNHQQEPLGRVHGNSYWTSLQIKGGATVESKDEHAEMEDTETLSKRGGALKSKIIVGFQEGKKVEMKKKEEAIVPLTKFTLDEKQSITGPTEEGLKGLIEKPIRGETAEVPVTKEKEKKKKKTYKIFYMPNRGNDPEIERELIMRKRELAERPDIKRKLAKFGMDPEYIGLQDVPPDAPRGGKAFQKQLDAEIFKMLLSMRLLLPFNPVTERFHGL